MRWKSGIEKRAADVMIKVHRAGSKQHGVEEVVAEQEPGLRLRLLKKQDRG